MGEHALIDSVYCQSLRRAVAIEGDATTVMLFRMRSGASGYLGAMSGTDPGFSVQVFGSNGWVRLEGLTHATGAPPDARRFPFRWTTWRTAPRSPKPW